MADRKAVIGLVINPIAGMGGKVALKGTDGKETLDKARERGARPESLKKTERALEKLRPYSGQLQLLTVSGTMGAALCEKMGFSYTIVYVCSNLHYYSCILNSTVIFSYSHSVG